MATNGIAKVEAAPDMAAIEAVVCAGDLARLTPDQKITWYRARCDAAGLDWRANPFDYLTLNGKLVLYANKGATDQIAANGRLCVEIVSREVVEGDLYEVQARVSETGSDPRRTDEIGSVSIKGLVGENLANAHMKAVTKAKRRAILSHCGLGMLDETETETIRGARHVVVDEDTGEVLEDARPQNTAQASAQGTGRVPAIQGTPNTPAAPDGQGDANIKAALGRVKLIAEKHGIPTEGGWIKRFLAIGLNGEYGEAFPEPEQWGVVEVGRLEKLIVESESKQARAQAYDALKNLFDAAKTLPESDPNHDPFLANTVLDFVNEKANATGVWTDMSQVPAWGWRQSARQLGQKELALA